MNFILIIIGLFVEIFSKYSVSNIYKKGGKDRSFLYLVRNDVRYSEDLYPWFNLNEIKTGEGGYGVRYDVIIWGWKKDRSF